MDITTFSSAFKKAQVSFSSTLQNQPVDTHSTPALTFTHVQDTFSARQARSGCPNAQDLDYTGLDD